MPTNLRIETPLDAIVIPSRQLGSERQSDDNDCCKERLTRNEVESERSTGRRLGIVDTAGNGSQRGGESATEDVRPASSP